MNDRATVTRTQVGIVGGGPAGLMLSHLLAKSGIDSIVLEQRSYQEIYETNRAGILEPGSVRMLIDTGVSDRVLTDGVRHEAVNFRFDGENHRLDFAELLGQAVWVYPQTEVWKDLADVLAREGGDVRFRTRVTSIADVTMKSPSIHVRDHEGRSGQIQCETVIGADGSKGLCKAIVPKEHRTDYFHRYPFAWFAIMVQSPPSANELIYTNSDHGFALISQRTESLQRLYFQCDPDEDPDTWSDDRIWMELRSRMAGTDGFELQGGPILEKNVLGFNSYVREPMQYGRMFLAGDAAHVVPPTGAKGLNLALADVKVLHEALESFFRSGSENLLVEYSNRALERVWRAQNFSYWMTVILHHYPDMDAFQRRRQRADLHARFESRAGRTFLAHSYTGWPAHGLVAA
ncbi:4-hydroxybenzoate 3-monooxygenase [Nitrospira sp. Nam74]